MKTIFAAILSILMCNASANADPLPLINKPPAEQKAENFKANQDVSKQTPFLKDGNPDKDANNSTSRGRDEKNSLLDRLLDFNLAEGIIAIFTIVIGIFTVFLFLDGKEKNKKELRAYLTVLIGGGMYQERDRGWYFEVRPALLNSGHTPAHNVNYWAWADILPFPLPENFKFDPHENPNKGSMVIGPNQGIELNAIVDKFIPDDEVESVKLGKNRRAYIWGIVTYTDVFNEIHTTKFCNSIFWLKSIENGVIKEKISGTYSYHHNEAT